MSDWKFSQEQAKWKQTYFNNNEKVGNFDKTGTMMLYWAQQCTINLYYGYPNIQLQFLW